MKRLGRIAGCDHSSLSRLENGSRGPSREMALTLADALFLRGAARARFLSLAGYIELPLSNAQAAAVTAWWMADGITTD